MRVLNDCVYESTAAADLSMNFMLFEISMCRSGMMKHLSQASVSVLLSFESFRFIHLLVVISAYTEYVLIVNCCSHHTTNLLPPDSTLVLKTKQQSNKHKNSYPTPPSPLNHHPPTTNSYATSTTPDVSEPYVSNTPLPTRHYRNVSENAQQTPDLDSVSPFNGFVSWCNCSWVKFPIGKCLRAKV